MDDKVCLAVSCCVNLFVCVAIVHMNKSLQSIQEEGTTHDTGVQRSKEDRRLREDKG